MSSWCVCVCVCLGKAWSFDKGTRKSHSRPNRVHVVSLCVIGGVIESVWLSETGGGMVIYVDIGPAVLILALTAEVEGLGGTGWEEQEADNGVN